MRRESLRVIQPHAELVVVREPHLLAALHTIDDAFGAGAKATFDRGSEMA